jgi:hypothetical protein
MLAIALESPFPDEVNKKLSPAGEHLGRGEPDPFKRYQRNGKNHLLNREIALDRWPGPT